MELCEKLKQIRKENNLTQQQLADELCLSRTVITKYERGHRVPNLDTLILISNYFKTSIFDEYKNKIKLFILSIKCITPYLISLIILLCSSLTLITNTIKVNNQYGYNIYNDELKVKNCENIVILKVNYSVSEKSFGISSKLCVSNTNIVYNFKYINDKYLNIINNNCFYLIFIKQNEFNEKTAENEITISHKPFIYPLKDYDESLPYNEQTSECSKILNYYIDLIEKFK